MAEQVKTKEVNITKLKTDTKVIKASTAKPKTVEKIKKTNELDNTGALLAEIEGLKSKMKAMSENTQVLNTPTKSRRNRLLETDLIVIFNDEGIFIAKNKEGKALFYKKITGLNGKMDMTFEEFKVLYNQSYGKPWIDNGIIAILEVESNEFTKADIVDELNLGMIYNDKFDVSDMGAILELSLAEIKEIVEGNKLLVETLANYSMLMHKVGKFNNDEKKGYFSSKFPNNVLYK